MDADLDTLATALHVTIDDCRENRPAREVLATREGICPKLTDAELLALATAKRSDLSRLEEARD